MIQDAAPKILVAPLNWGLGHATRCIPIICALRENGYEPVIASDGQALALLSKEFPELTFLELPSYNIEYPMKGESFKWKMLKNAPNMLEAMAAEKKLVKKWVKNMSLKGVISDNRLGVYSKKVPSVIITHQLNVLSGNTSWITGKLHRMIIGKFNECWIPDVELKPNLSGKLGHLNKPTENLVYIGPLSRFELQESDIKYDLLVVLSGPEPHRSILQKQLETELLFYRGKVLMVNGVVEENQKTEQKSNLTIWNFMTTDQLQKAYNQSKCVLCRSGYTTLMDLAKLRKKAFLIPTPGQYEQEYLAKRMRKEGLLPSAKQEKFRIENLLEIDLYKGLPDLKQDVHWRNLFCLFEGE